MLYNKLEVMIMDTVKIGRFLSELRHERGFTQEQLGERLGISNKTVSRWENGNYLPPVEMLMVLSEFYGVSINEILSGRKLDSADIQPAAEDNLKSVLRDSSFSLEDRKRYFIRKWRREHWYCFVLPTVIALLVIIVSTILNEPIGVFAGCVGSIPARFIAYNKMMSYVEGRVFREYIDSSKN